MSIDSFEALKTEKKNDFGDMVIQTILTCSENEKKTIHIKNIDPDIQTYELPPGIFEFVDNQTVSPSFITATIDENNFRTVLRNQPKSAKVTFSNFFPIPASDLQN